MKISLENGLPYAGVTITFRGKEMFLEKVLVDTGSGGSIFSADLILGAGIQMEKDDAVHRIRGIGGTEFVFSKRIDRLTLGDLEVDDFEIEVGAMDCGCG